MGETDTRADTSTIVEAATDHPALLQAPRLFKLPFGCASRVCGFMLPQSRTWVIDARLAASVLLTHHDLRVPFGAIGDLFAPGFAFTAIDDRRSAFPAGRSIQGRLP